MNILICDDDIVFLKSFKEKLMEYKCPIYSFNNIENLKNTDIVFDIAFLDIEFNNSTNGFEIGNYLRSRNPKCVIAFFTNYRKYAIEGYKYGVCRYILKNEPERLIKRNIHDVFLEFYRQKKVIRGSYKDKTFAVAVDDIFYIDVYNHTIKIHSQKGEFEMYKQIKEIYEELQDFGFIRCHRSYIVNIKYIGSMRSDGHFALNTPNKDKIPIGISYKDVAKEKYLTYFSV